MIVTPDSITDYCIVCNEVAKRKDLSARSKGIYYYLATLPKNWELSQQELLKHFTEGRQSITTAFKELVNLGYIEQKRKQDELGLFKGYTYKVNWTCKKPVNQKTEIGKPVDGKTEIGKTDTTNYLYKLNTKRVNTKEEELLKKHKSDFLKSKFDIFWENYGKSKEKKASFEKFKKLSPDIIELAIFKAKKQAENVEVKFRKDPKRWLAGECWNDVIVSSKQVDTKKKGKINESSYS